MDMNPAAVFHLKRLQTETFVRQIDWHRELPSTNDRALELAVSENIETPLLVLTGCQTAGRGRGANRWWSSPGGLTFSLIVETPQRNLPADRWLKMSLTAGLAVCEVLQELLPEAKIGLKWPNDVLLDGRKVCGILVEVPVPRAGRLVLGIGINVNNSLSTAPPELRATATAIVDFAHRQHDLTDVLVRIVRQLAEGLRLLTIADANLSRRWQTFCLLQDCTVQLDADSGRTVGICRGIDPEGALTLETETGTERFFSGVVTSFG